MPRPHPPEFRRRAVELARSDKFLDLVSVQTTPLGGLQVFYGAPQGNGTKRARSALARPMTALSSFSNDRSSTRAGPSRCRNPSTSA